MRNKIPSRFFLILAICAISTFYFYPPQEKINLGLDLKGGMYLLVRVDTSKLSKEQAYDAAARSLNVIRNRIDRYGIVEPNIVPQGREHLLIQLPGAVDRDRVMKIIKDVAFLEFKLVEEDPQLLAQAKEGNVPSGYELKELKDKTPILLKAEAAIIGADLADAQSTFDSNMLPVIQLSLNGEGAKKFATLTQEHVGERLAIVLDGVVQNAPTIKEPILTGDAQITGEFTVDEARDLALKLRAGALPAPLVVEHERTVGPLLGSDSIRRGVSSIIFGAAGVILFMLIYYLIGGLIAVICLILDLLIIMGALGFLGTATTLKASLTLPGIAGMILTLGMAVDANVLIFERIWEELSNKKPLVLAVKNGFDKAKRTIFDANITTLIAALFLLIYGTGPIRGFATTLSVGIAASMFTAIFVGRTVLVAFVNLGLKNFVMLHVLRAPKINFVKARNFCFILSLLVIIVGGVSFESRIDTIFGIDFKGGQLLEYKLTPVTSIDKVRSLLEAGGISGITLQDFRDIEGGVIIKSREDITDKAENILGQHFQEVERLNITTIGPAVGNILKKKALLAVLLSLLGILIYVTFRFKHFDFAFAALCALIHDIAIAVGFISLFGYQITLLTITALLTIAGYSINDTIVVYDRIREISPRMHKASLKEIVNTAINQTFSRTVITSLTTIFVVVCIFVLGGEALRGFSFTLLVGFIAGTYSSIYIASPLVLLFRRARLRR